MAQAYSDDLRRKLLEAHDQGQGSLVELAARFGVSCGWAWKISAARKRTGQIERQQYRHGPTSQLNQEGLARLLAAKPDLTLRELQSAVEKQTGVRFSTSYLWLVLKRMNFRLKKSRSMPRNATAKSTDNGARGSSKRSVPSRRNA